MPSRPFAIPHAADLAFDKAKLRELAAALENDPRFTLKYDGSSFYFGRDNNGKPFVSTQRLFNVHPKLYYTAEDLQDDEQINPNVKRLMIQLFPYIIMEARRAGIGQAIGADLMYANFSNKQTSIRRIDGDLHIQANLMVHVIDGKSELAREIEQSKYGMAVHSLWDLDGDNAPTDYVVHNMRQAEHGVVFPSEPNKLPDYKAIEEVVNTIKDNLYAIPQLEEDDINEIRRQIFVNKAETGGYLDLDDVKLAGIGLAGFVTGSAAWRAIQRIYYALTGLQNKLIDGKIIPSRTEVKFSYYVERKFRGRTKIETFTDKAGTVWRKKVPKTYTEREVRDFIKQRLAKIEARKAAARAGRPFTRTGRIIKRSTAMRQLKEQSFLRHKIQAIKDSMKGWFVSGKKRWKYRRWSTANPLEGFVILDKSGKVIAKFIDRNAQDKALALARRIGSSKMVVVAELLYDSTTGKQDDFNYVQAFSPTIPK